VVPSIGRTLSVVRARTSVFCAGRLVRRFVPAAPNWASGAFTVRTATGRALEAGPGSMDPWTTLPSPLRP